MLQYLVGHLKILWQFLRGDEEALYKIDANERGLKWSFIYLFIASFLLGFVVALPAIMRGQVSALILLHPVSLIQLVISVALIPALFYLLSGLFDFRKVILPLVVSYNWMSLTFMLLGLVIGAVIVVPLTLFAAMLSGSSSLLVILIFLLGMGYVFFYFRCFHRLIQFVIGEPKQRATSVFAIVVIAQFTVALFSFSMTSS